MCSGVRCGMLAGLEMSWGKKLGQFKHSVSLEDETSEKLPGEDCEELRKEDAGNLNEVRGYYSTLRMGAKKSTLECLCDLQWAKFPQVKSSCL